MKKLILMITILITILTPSPRTKQKLFNRLQSVKIIHYIPHIVKTNISTTDKIEYKTFKITAYDLTYDSCNKYPTDKHYGITRYGIDLRGLNYETARIIAADPNLFQYGTLIEIKFDLNNWRSIYNGVYMVGDTGGGIKGNHFDLFLGENEVKKCFNFGISYAKIRVVDSK